MLFVIMKPGVLFTSNLVARINAAIRSDLSPGHGLTWVFQTPQVPVCSLHQGEGESDPDIRHQTIVNGMNVEAPRKKILSD